MPSLRSSAAAVGLAAVVGGALEWWRRSRTAPTQAEVRQAIAREASTRRRLADLEAIEAQVRVERDEAETLLDRLLRSAPVGIGFIDTDLRFTVVNEALAAINGVSEDDHRGRRVTEVLPDLAEQNEAILRRVLDTGDALVDIEVRGATPADPDTPHDWLASYVPVEDDDGALMGVAVSVVDITERQAMSQELGRLREEMAADRFRRALDSLVDSVILVSPVHDDAGGVSDLRVDWVNAAALDAHGRTAEQMLGGSFRGLWPGEDGLRSFQLFCQSIDRGEPVVDPTFRYRFDDVDGPAERFFDLRVVPFADGALGSWRDVTDDVLSRRRLAERERALAEAQRVGRIGSWRVDMDGGGVEVSAELRRMLGRDLVDFDDLMTAIDPDGRDELIDAIRATLRSGNRFVVEHRILRPGSDLLEVRTIGEVERREDGTVERVSGVSQDVTDLRRTEQRVRVLSDELAAEHSTLLALQESLLPQQLPALPGYELDARYLGAADRVEVGGDWFDVVELAGGRLALVVGDAAGHGLAAVGVMAEVRHALRAYLAECAGPAEALARTGSLLRAERGTLATCVVAELDPVTGSVRWSSAGHLAPVAARGEAGPPGPPLGAVTGADYPQWATQLAPGESLLMFTDGLVERRDEPIDVGLARVRENWSQVAGTSMPLAALLASMFGGEPPGDDVCVLVCRRLIEG